MMSHNYVANKSKSTLMRKLFLCCLLEMLSYSDPGSYFTGSRDTLVTVTWIPHKTEL